ncbi:septum formation inhibitor Maf [Maribacter sp. ACAM166]|uniref:septum formation inhibitor Maf n=1 Tax=Maribacter sp. ACAM166 TaxID=2508996 RepID=UPI0010FED0F4|nr:septum formation inhibitor Maf [Maribacter sp. ACAM166]TLP79611.1 septum formation inhibitor Maf [Maribacter sp. ACAM166]
MNIFKFYSIITVVFAMVVLSLTSCKEKTVDKINKLDMGAIEQKPEAPKKQLSQEFKDFWYAGNAEVTSYKLQQARYGEIRKGKAVLIYVTEPFLSGLQVKADTNDSSNIPVLKLNSTKNYLTGIYPYSIMTSSFYPVYDNQHALKVTFSSQEWCGHVYAQLNNRADYEIMSHSYFGSEADQNFLLDKSDLENEIWNKIRINPGGLPTGNIEIIPSLEYIRLNHKELKVYSAIATITKSGANTIYQITYPELERTLKINFLSEFPYTIEGWTDTYKDGFGQKAIVLTSTATIINRITTPYWQQNSNKDLSLRDSLGL